MERPPKPISAYNAITSTFETFPSAGSWDAVYDLWLNNWGIEIMIWNQWTGTQLSPLFRKVSYLSHS